jgi:hypothetical protein
VIVTDICIWQHTEVTCRRQWTFSSTAHSIKLSSYIPNYQIFRYVFNGQPTENQDKQFCKVLMPTFLGLLPYIEKSTKESHINKFTKKLIDSSTYNLTFTNSIYLYVEKMFLMDLQACWLISILNPLFTCSFSILHYISPSNGKVKCVRSLQIFTSAF